jgi:hypothetical protein
MFSDQVLLEVIFPMALMLTIRKVALPDIKVAMALVLVADPVSFSLE